MITRKGTMLVAAMMTALIGGLGSAHAQAPIKLGVLATLEGPFAASGQDAMRGARLALEQAEYKAGGRQIELVTASSNATPDSALRAVRRLVENDRIDIMIGPLSGSEGIAVKNYSMEQPGVTFINGTSAAQQTTLENPSENFFRFSTEGVQWQAGLGSYVYKEKGYRSVAVIAEDYSFPYAQIMGFMTEFCAAGGRVPQKFFVPIESRDYSSVIARLPRDVDAIYVVLGGSDALNFLDQYQQMGGRLPMIASSVTVDQSILSARGRQRDYLIGTPSAGPIADDWNYKAWDEFKKAYRAMFPDGLPSPGLFAYTYYVNTLAALTALDQVDGNLSDGHSAIRNALKNLELMTPTGIVTIDHNRQAIANNFITEVAQNGDGQLYNQVIKVVEGVNQTLGFSEADFLAGGFAGRNVPECP